MATPKYQGIKLGPGGLETKIGEVEIFSKTTAPVNGPAGIGDGKDGDVWIQTSGTSSAIYQKANNIWINIVVPSLGNMSILGDSTVNGLAISYDSSAYRTAQIEYYVQSMSGEYERGTISIVNNGTNAFYTQSGVNNTSNLGIDFTVSISGANVELRYNSSASPTGRILYYALKH